MGSPDESPDESPDQGRRVRFLMKDPNLLDGPLNQGVAGRMGRTAHILVIDDSRGDAMLARKAIDDSRVNAVVTIASTGEMAMDILRRQGEYVDRVLPDIILLDLRLPRMSGMDVLNLIKGDPRFKHIPVIVMSGSGALETIMTCYRSYANAYLIKPGDLTQYRAAVDIIERFYLELAALPVAAYD
jgi:two-component system, chemotaxis family, response regulator Rcp1